MHSVRAEHAISASIPATPTTSRSASMSRHSVCSACGAGCVHMASLPALGNDMDMEDVLHGRGFYVSTSALTDYLALIGCYPSSELGGSVVDRDRRSLRRSMRTEPSLHSITRRVKALHGRSPSCPILPSSQSLPTLYPVKSLQP